MKSSRNLHFIKKIKRPICAFFGSYPERQLIYQEAFVSIESQEEFFIWIRICRKIEKLQKKQ